MFINGLMRDILDLLFKVQFRFLILQKGPNCLNIIRFCTLSQQMGQHGYIKLTKSKKEHNNLFTSIQNGMAGILL